MRIKELDGLRGLAAICVVFFHYTNGSNSYSNEVFFFKYGHYGVELFFIISGFVISMTLQRKNTFFQFWKARFFRLFPVYWICMTLTFAVTSFIGLDYMKRTFSQYLLNTPMISKFISVKFIDGSYWSLQYELFFYLIMACIFYFLTKNLSKILLIFGGLTLIQICINILDFNIIMTNYGGLVSTLYFRLYGILFIEYVHLFTVGIALFTIIKEKKSWAWAYVALGIVSSISISIEDFIATVLIMGILFSALWLKWSVWRSKIMIWLGSISYVLYLIHMFIGRSVIMYLVDNEVAVHLAIAITILLIMGIATLLTKFIERPLFNKLTGKTNKPNITLKTHE